MYAVKQIAHSAYTYCRGRFTHIPINLQRALDPLLDAGPPVTERQRDIQVHQLYTVCNAMQQYHNHVLDNYISLFREQIRRLITVGNLLKGIKTLVRPTATDLYELVSCDVIHRIVRNKKQVQLDLTLRPIDQPQHQRKKEQQMEAAQNTVIKGEQIKEVRVTKKLIQRVCVSGLSHHDYALNAKRIEVGDKLELIRDKGNVYDPCATQVHFDGFHIGWIPKEQNEMLAKLLDAGFTIAGYVVSHDTAGSLTKRLYIGVYIDFLDVVMV